MPNVMLDDAQIKQCPHCKQRYFDLAGSGRTHYCVCHFCAKPFDWENPGSFEARCRVCEGFRDPAHTGVVWFCGECARNRQISAAPRLVDFRKAAVVRALQKPFHDLLRHAAAAQTNIQCVLDPTNDHCCCDGERLIRLLEDFVPAYADVLKNV